MDNLVVLAILAVIILYSIQEVEVKVILYQVQVEATQLKVNIYWVYINIIVMVFNPSFNMVIN